MSEQALCLHELSFAYPGGNQVLANVSLSVPAGSFALLVGATGSGKTTLLRLCKAEIAPVGERVGELRVFGRDVSELSLQESSRAVGYVFQNPNNQIVCDSVWHELAFGLENLGMPPQEMRLRIAETCYFLGIEPWFRRKTSELSGGQRQVLALAGALVMRPRILLLDEPLAMLDPVAGKSFLALLQRVHQELGTTVVVATHNPRDLRSFASQAFVVEAGAVREASLEEVCAEQSLVAEAAGGEHASGAAVAGARQGSACIRVTDAWLRYTREGSWVLRGLNIEVGEGEARALVGGNACGKSTLLQLMARTLKPQRGKLTNRHAACQALLPQDPKALLACETVEDELCEWMSKPRSSSSRARMEE
ncbi:MAG: ABC transporter ATP-binding protein, partial [Coriobacteriales bacterium]|nr:ABC transporter ATP-binding protein [Coriobacteriales bacterium]